MLVNGEATDAPDERLVEGAVPSTNTILSSVKHLVRLLVCLTSETVAVTVQSANYIMGNGAARGGRCFCKADIQVGSNPTFSTIINIWVSPSLVWHLIWSQFYLF